MAKQRPSLGVSASPVSTFVTPIDPQKMVTPVDESAVRNAYDFAEAFSNLSETAAKFATTIKTQQNKEEFLAGMDMVNANRKTYADLVGSGQIKPSENPWLAVGAQEASGVLEAAKAREQFKAEYDRAVANNPELLKDHQFFDALASSFATQKNAEFGTSQYLSRSFYKEFNPFIIEQSAAHSDAVGKYAQKKIIDSLKIKVDEVVNAAAAIPSFGLRPDGTPKDVGYYGVLQDLSGNAVTEKAIGVEIDGAEVQIPLLVPGLSLEAKEAILFSGDDADPKELVDSLDPRDQKLIFDHAMKRMKEGRSPFFSSLDDRIVPDLQSYLDETGQNMGLPRIANLAVASHLIDIMAKSGSTYEAEAVLSRLSAGTGKLMDVSEVKTMLLDANADIQKTRFDLGVSGEKNAVSVWIQKAADTAYADALKGKDNENYGAFVDEWRTDIRNSFKYLSVEESAKMFDQFNERWNNATREGREGAERADIEAVKYKVNAKIDEAISGGGGDILDWGSIKNAMESSIEVRGIIDEPKKNSVRREASFIVTQKLDNLVGSLLDKYNIDDMVPNPRDTGDVRKRKSEARLIYKMNELQAAIHFDLEDRLESLRRVALNGISVDVEQGLRPELADLVIMYKNSTGGRSPLDVLLPKMGSRGERTLKFLQLASIKWQAGVMDLPDAVRDAAQALNMDSEADVLSLTDIRENGADMQAFRLKVDEAITAMSTKGWRGWVPFFDTSVPLNPDARKSAASMFSRKFVEEMASSSGAIRTSLSNAKDYVVKNSMIVNGGVLPRDVFEAHGVGESYIASFIGVELGEDLMNKDAALVWVDNSPNGEPVFAFRTAEGKALKDRYYTISDIVGTDTRRKVVSFMAEQMKKESIRKTEIEKMREKTPSIRPKF